MRTPIRLSCSKFQGDLDTDSFANGGGTRGHSDASRVNEAVSREQSERKAGTNEGGKRRERGVVGMASAGRLGAEVEAKNNACYDEMQP